MPENISCYQKLFTIFFFFFFFFPCRNIGVLWIFQNYLAKVQGIELLVFVDLNFIPCSKLQFVCQNEWIHLIKINKMEECKDERDCRQDWHSNNPPKNTLKYIYLLLIKVKFFKAGRLLINK